MIRHFIVLFETMEIQENMLRGLEKTVNKNKGNTPLRFRIKDDTLRSTFELDSAMRIHVNTDWIQNMKELGLQYALA
jgi:hypothetical protein